MITAFYEVMNIPQPTGVKTAEDEVTDIHNPSTNSDHFTAEILKEMSPLPGGRYSE
jgi:hypothetical protein